MVQSNTSVLAVLSCQQMLRCQRGGEWPMCPFVVDDDNMVMTYYVLLLFIIYLKIIIYV